MQLIFLQFFPSFLRNICLPLFVLLVRKKKEANPVCSVYMSFDGNISLVKGMKAESFDVELGRIKNRCIEPLKPLKNAQ